ncbi:beta-propeller fold lactonase family protein [Flagellimonas meishanensis]|uniref:beta-propeller fold lactonase family protein n=1 Tax=Flagellimonas meishanensis TaxID=2873264 RepID=UPI001CA60CCF|nr:beta-propeller fold lactonase family protein [[Muricauda] meishanensis]
MPKLFHFLFGLVVLISACTESNVPKGIAYVSNEDSGTVSIVDLNSLQVVDSISVGKRPRGIRLSPDGKKLYVALSGSPKCPPWMPNEECESQIEDKSADGIAEIDLEQKKVIRVIEGGSDPEQFDITKDGALLFVSNEDIGKASVLDLNKGEILKQLTVGGEPEGVKISPDQRLALVTNEADASVSVIDVATLEVINNLAVGNRPRDICFHPDNNLVYISNEFNHSVSILDLSNNIPTEKIQLEKGQLPMGLALDVKSNKLFVATGRGQKVVSYNIKDKKLLQEAIVGKRPWGIALTSNKKFLISANGPSNDVTILDTKNFQIIKKIQVGRNPWGVVIGSSP